MFITLVFDTNERVDLVINDYYLNLIMWYPIIALGDQYIGPQHLVFEKKFTKSLVKNYLDKHFVIPRKGTIPNKILNNIIADFLYQFVDIDRFAMFISNTLNLEDSIELMNASKEYDDVLHVDLSNELLGNVQNKGMEYVRKAQDIIMNAEQIMGHEHCLRNPFASGEGINAKQYKDNSISIGTKPDGQGSIYHEIINQSYITGGLNKLMYQFIDSASARVAQIISKKNVGDSGGFARILGLNNAQACLNPDPTFDCGTNNYLIQHIPNKDILKMLNHRFYRLHPHGPLFEIDADADFHLIGKTVYLRSPIFCQSYANGHGICKTCYGAHLYYVNLDISVGRIASEIITSQYTQMRLSAKHLLASNVIPILWNENFARFFTVDINHIQLRNDLDFTSIKDWKICFSFSDIQLEVDDDFYRHDFYGDDKHSTQDDGPFYNEYITQFKIINHLGEEFFITSVVERDDVSNEPAKLYFTRQFSDAIRKSLSLDDASDMITLNLTELVDINIFILKMQNNDIGYSLDEFSDLINKKSVTKTYNASELINKLQLNTIKGNIHCSSVHLEVLIANQVRNAHDRSCMPNWYNINEPYELLTLNEALKDNNSPIIALTYQKLADTMKYAKTFHKFSPSIYDLFYMRKPKKFLNVDHEILDIPNQPAAQPGDAPYIRLKKGTPLPTNAREFTKRFDPRPKIRLDDQMMTKNKGEKSPLFII